MITDELYQASINLPKVLNLRKRASAEIRAKDANQPVAFESELFTELRPEHRDGTLDALPIFYLRDDGRKRERH